MKTLFSKIVIIALMQGLAGSVSAHVGLDYPVGGETLISGTTITIQWHIEIPHNTLNWDLLFSSDGGTTWEFIQMDLPVNNLSYQWVVPSTITSQARVSVIQDNSGTDYQDESMNFTIQLPTMLPFIVSVAMDTIIESDVATQDMAIQSWLDNHGGASVNSFCDDLVWSNDFSILSDECGITGSALVTFTATDQCGSTETIATVTVTDTSPPVLIQEATPLLVECDGNGNTAQLIAWESIQGGAIASDAGGIVNWFGSETWSGIICGSTQSVVVTFNAYDECDNITSFQSTFTIEDHTAPDIQISAKDTTMECGLPNTQAILQNWLDRHGGATANDICGGVTWTNDFPVVVDTCHATTVVPVTFMAMDECGNSNTTTANVTLMGTSGTSSTDAAEFIFNISPNPVSHTLKVETDQSESTIVHLSLFNAAGKSVFVNQDHAAVIYISVHGYPPGLYYLQAETNHGVCTQKVIID